MSGTSNGSRDEYTFKKLQGSHNYKQWTSDMSFALEEARLWRHVERTAVLLLSLEAKKMIVRIEWKRSLLGKKRSVNFRTKLARQ